jgi:pyruvyltransferase
MILADAFGIPSMHIKFSDNVVGGSFKFNDYFASVGRPADKPLVVAAGNLPTAAGMLKSAPSPYRLKIDLRELINAAPFLDDQRKAALNARVVSEHPAVRHQHTPEQQTPAGIFHRR